MSTTTGLRRVVVTGGNSGIGFAICQQLVSEDKCHVYLGARTESKGVEAVKKIQTQFPDVKANIEFLHLDVDSDASVKAAAASVAPGLFALVNNAGIGLSHKVTDFWAIVDTNYFGAKRVSEAFIPLIQDNGKLVNMGSGVSSSYIVGTMGGTDLCSVAKEDRLSLTDPNVTLDQINTIVTAERDSNFANGGGWCAYAVSKCALTAYTMIQARENPNLVVSVVSPGFIKTAMTVGFGATIEPSHGTVSTRHCLFNIGLEKSGWYWGSDGKRSPLDRGRDPGDPEYSPHI